MEVDVASFDLIPRRVFLDTCVVNLALDYGEQLHDNMPIPQDLTPRLTKDIEALRHIRHGPEGIKLHLAVHLSRSHGNERSEAVF